MPSERVGPLAAFAVVSVVCALVVVANMARHPHTTVTAVEAAQVAHTGPEVRFGSVLAPRPRHGPLTGNVLSVALNTPVTTALEAPRSRPAPSPVGHSRVARPASSRHSSAQPSRPRRPSAPHSVARQHRRHPQHRAHEQHRQHPTPASRPPTHAAPGHSGQAPGHRRHGHGQAQRPAAPGHSSMAPGHLQHGDHAASRGPAAHGHGRALGRR